MFRLIDAFWKGVLIPLFQRPKRLQVAALCHRTAGADTEVLLVTSRGTGRWIIPKGWPIRGLNASEAATREAWEEAGVNSGTVDPKPIGRYTYNKTQRTGWSIPVETLVYSVPVDSLADTFPEAHQRTRKWVKTKDAADMVNETQLKTILRQF